MNRITPTTIVALLASPALAQTTPPPTCFDSMANPCNNGCVDSPGFGAKSIVIFVPPIDCVASGSYASAGAAAVYDPKQCGISHGKVEVFDDYDVCVNTSLNCDSSACAHASAGNQLAAACASTDNDIILIESFIERFDNNQCYVAEAAFAASSAWIQPEKTNEPSEACITFETPAYPNELTFHGRITSCGCEWVVSSPNGDLTSSNVMEIATPDPLNNTWSICCYLSSNGDPFTIISLDLPVSTWDVNSDGRFNATDVHIIINSIQTAIQNCTSNQISDCVSMAYDINADGDIDSEDIDLLWELLDCGFDTGYFGDFDQDGDVDCDDYDSGQLFLNAQTGSQFTPIPITNPAYIFQLDQDLDGLIDTDDINAFLALFPTCP